MLVISRGSKLPWQIWMAAMTLGNWLLRDGPFWCCCPLVAKHQHLLVFCEYLFKSILASILAWQNPKSTAIHIFSSFTSEFSHLHGFVIISRFIHSKQPPAISHLSAFISNCYFLKPQRAQLVANLVSAGWQKLLFLAQTPAWAKMFPCFTQRWTEQSVQEETPQQYVRTLKRLVNEKTK